MLNLLKSAFQTSRFLQALAFAGRFLGVHAEGHLREEAPRMTGDGTKNVEFEHVGILGTIRNLDV